MPYAERPELLVGLDLAGPEWCTVPSWTEVAADELLAACDSLDVEGVVAKSTDSPYRPDGGARSGASSRPPPGALVTPRAAGLDFRRCKRL